MATFDIPALKLYAKDGYNVLLSGKHGVGKTAIIKEVFDEAFGAHGVSWKYFSASTLDPWVDFVGIPDASTQPDGTRSFQIIPPSAFTGTEKIEALFFDEINRADEKTLNAIMELIQFRSINGRPFPHLKCIWAAENPADDADESYSVRPLDPAQKDRFHIQMDIPYEMSSQFFREKFGSVLTQTATRWWAAQQPGNKPSPRKMDQILVGFQQGHDIAHFTNLYSLDELAHSLQVVASLEEMRKIAEAGDGDIIRKHFTIAKLRESSTQIFDSGRDVLGAIYEHLDGETQEYIQQEFKFNPGKGDSAMMPESVVAFLSYCETQTQQPNRSPFLIELSDVLGYADNMQRAFADVGDDVDLFDAFFVESGGFPFEYKATALEESVMQEIGAKMTSSRLFRGKAYRDLIQTLFKRMAWICWVASKNSQDQNASAVIMRSDMFRAFVKFGTSRTIVKALNVNAIKFNVVRKAIAEGQSIDETYINELVS